MKSDTPRNCASQVFCHGRPECYPKNSLFIDSHIAWLFIFSSCSSSKTILIRWNKLDRTNSTQPQARINSVFGRQLTVKYVGQEIHIIFIWKGKLSWLIFRYLQKVWQTWMLLPQKFTFHRLPYCLTFYFPSCSSSKTILILEIALIVQLLHNSRPALTVYLESNSP